MARILGLDPGEKRCGVAVTDSGETMAFPRGALAVTSELIGQIRQLCDEELIELVVVGRPLGLSGSTTASTARADIFFHELSLAVELPVVQWDERLTTSSAQRALHDAGLSAKESRDRVDSAAAVVLLESYAEARHAG